MTFCGYDPEMSEGLVKFGKGVAASTLKKAASAGHTVGKQIDVELTQLKALISELHQAEKQWADEGEQNRAMALRGLALVCQSAFQSSNNIDDAEALQRHFADQFVLFGELVRKLEDAFEGARPEASLSEKTATAVELAIAAS